MPDGSLPPPRWLDEDALAAHLSVRVRQIRHMVRTGRLPAPSLALGRTEPRWWSADVDAAMGRGVASPAPGAASLAEAIRTQARRRPDRPQAPR